MTTPTAPAPTVFFDQSNGGFQTVQVCNAVEAWFGAICTNQGEQLYAYHDGVWQPGAEREIKERLVTLLGDRYRPAHAATVLEVFRSRSPHLTDEPQTQYLNLPNGLLDWRTGELAPHTADVPSTVRIPVEWDPAAECPAIDRWIAQVFPADCRELVEEVIGACLIDAAPVHKAVLLNGTGRNGKGTFIRLLTRLLGPDNVCAVNPQTLDQNRFTAAELYGKLANLAGDVDARRFTGTEVFKQVTGGDRLKAERKYGQPFYFTSRATMIAAYNELPTTSDLSEGFFSRWVVVPMTGYFPAGQADFTVEDRIGAPEELRGLLVAGVRGLRRLMERGTYSQPRSAVVAEDAYRESVDPVLAWLREVGPQLVGRRPRAYVYAEFKVWCIEAGIRPPSNRKLYERLEAAGVETGLHIWSYASNGVRGFEFSPSFEPMV